MNSIRTLKIFFLSCIIFSAFLIQANAQITTENISVTGLVTDINGEPLPGVSIQSEDKSSGAISDGKGHFQLKVKKDALLSFSYIGYLTQRVPLHGKTLLNVSLKVNTESQKLNEVVVVGYGTQKKSDITGSISSISASSYKDQPIVNVSSALQGRASGVEVSNSSGNPGSSVKIRIRGANSITSNNDPLIVVDGIALGSTGLDDINVNDIASTEVLKDASATAIYGSRGANGVVLITTKSGQAGKTVVSYNSFLSQNQLPKKYDLLGPVQYAQLVNHIDGASTYPDPASLAGKGTDWQSKLYRNGYTQNQQLSISGATEKSKYYLSAYYVNESGIIINTSQKKFSFRSNVETKINDRITVNMDLFGTRNNSHNNGDLGGIGNPVISTLVWPSNQEIYNSPGVYNRSIPAPIYLNPYMIARERDGDNASNLAILHGKVKYDITNWLSLSGNLGLDMNISHGAYLNNQWINPVTQSSGQNYYESYTWQNSEILTFHKTFNKIHAITATAIYEQTSNKSQSFNADGSGLSTTEYGFNNLGLNSAQAIKSGYTNWALKSYVGRLSYTLSDKYLLTATFRADGSSKFQESKNKWGYFPSAAIGWRLSEESFIKELNVFSNLKLRASYGVTGNQGINPYSTLGILNGQQYSYGTGVLYQGYTLGNPSNPNLKWESTYQADLGLDASILHDRLNFTVDYYNKNTKNLLLQQTIPDYYGGGSEYVNLGQVNNKGIELSIRAIPIRSASFTWNTVLNISSFKNKVISLGGQNLENVNPPGSGFINTNIQVVQVSQPLGSFYLIPWKGVYQTGQGAMGYKPGDNKYQDVSGNGSIGYEDRVLSGSALPKYQWGFNNDFTYKQFSLNVFFQASHGNKIFNGTYASAAVATSDVKYPTLAASANYWTPQNNNSQWADPASKTNRNYIESTQFLQDGSYIRMKNISLSYLLSRHILGFADIRFSVSAQNLLTITKYKGYDPEADTAGNSDAASGIDLGAYPNPKTYTIGLNAKF